MCAFSWQIGMNKLSGMKFNRRSLYWITHRFWQADSKPKQIFFCPRNASSLKGIKLGMTPVAASLLFQVRERAVQASLKIQAYLVLPCWNPYGTTRCHHHITNENISFHWTTQEQLMAVTGPINDLVMSHGMMVMVHNIWRNAISNILTTSMLSMEIATHNLSSGILF